MTKVLGVILARGGSKRVPGKNMRMLGDKPLVAWTIEAAEDSRGLGSFLVSSDNVLILDIARRWGVNGLARPAHLATDTASSYAALLHAIDATPGQWTHAVLLQPTSPFRTALDIDTGINLCLGANAPACASRERGKTQLNGAFYMATVEWLRAGGNWDAPGVLTWEMPPERSIDIDTLEDFARAERMIAERIAA